MNRDALASVRLVAVEVEFAGWTYTIEPLPSSTWIEAVACDDWTAIFPGLLRDPELERDAWSLVLTGKAGQEDLESAGRAALAAAGGRPWWEVDRLIRAAMSERASSMVLGGLIRTGFDFEERPLGAFLDAVYSFAIDGCTEDQRIKLDMELKTPPAGIDVDELYDEDEAADEFMTMHALGGA